MFVVFLALIFVASYALTAGLRHYANHRNVLAVPNERSSHSLPTPTGGGVAFVVTFLAAALLGYGQGWVSAALLLAITGAGLLIALTGWLDDRQHLPARWRICAHALAVAWGLYWLGGAPAISLFGVSFGAGIALSLLAAVGLIWLLNLYNFMDGINGIAGIQAITVAAAMLLLQSLSGGHSSAWLLWALVASVAGFLVWNFPRARIFMGDAGSGFLGLMFGLLLLADAHQQPSLLWAWLIVLGSFMVDASVTLLRRIYHGERFYQAHRSHAYQYAARRYQSHTPVSLAVGAINLLWLLPIAALVVTERLAGEWGLAIAYAPLVILVWCFKAGDSRRQLS